MTTDLAAYAPQSLERSATAAEIRAQVNLIQEVMQAVMKSGVHYGTIPGTQKPTLYKPGSEKILSTFRIACEPIVTDLSIPGEEARFRVEARGTTQSGGAYLGSGVGEASSNEEKYKWRAALCQDEFDATPEHRRRVAYKKAGWDKEAHLPLIERVQQVRTEPADLANTILKMAKKRAQIDMTLTVTAASDVFNQDIEDLPEAVREAVTAEDGAPAQSMQPPRRKSEARAAGGGASVQVTIAEIAEKSGTKQSGEPWTKYTATGSDQKKYGTFDGAHVAVLQEAREAGLPVAITYAETKYGRDIQAVAIIGREPGSDDA